MTRRERGGQGVDGVRITERARRPARAGWVLFGVATLVAGTLAWRWAAHAIDPRDAAATTPADGRVAAAVASPAAARSGRSARREGQAVTVAPTANRDGEDPTADLADYVLPGEAPSMGEVIAALHSRGIRTGLGAFPPPGTSPPLRGLEVPAGFELPEGYVRHHQATDDGERIAPILMFAPDREWIEIGGRRIRIPADRIVTPDLAPPGLPLRWVRIPPPAGGRR